MGRTLHLPSPLHLTAREAIAQIRAGRTVIVLDEQEGDGVLTTAADCISADAVNFMATHGRGLVCLALPPERVVELRLSMMMASGEARQMRASAFTVSIDARDGITTGISAPDRARTICAAVAAQAHPDELVSPGHVFPIQGQRGGVLVRPGHTEAAIDLARLAGRTPAGVTCEILRDDGELARLPDLEQIASRFQLGIVSVGALIHHRLAGELLVHQVGEATVRPRGEGLRGEYRVHHYRTDIDRTEYLALVLGDVARADAVLARFQPASMLGFIAQDAGSSSLRWLQAIERHGRGVLIYVLAPEFCLEAAVADLGHQAGPLRAERPLAPPPPIRSVRLATQVLVHLGVRSVRLLTDDPLNAAGLPGLDMEVA